MSAAPQDLTIRTSALDDNGNVDVHEGTISTSGDNQPGIQTSATGTTTISADGVTTTGRDSAGIDAHGYGPIAITAGTVATSGYGSTGIDANNNIGGQSGGIDISAGTVTTTGDAASGIRAMGYQGNTSVTADTIKTSGIGSDGIYAWSYEGNATVKVGALETTGDSGRGIVAYSGGTTTVIADTVTTSGQGFDTSSDAGGIKAVGAAVTVEAGSVSTAGAYSAGIYASSNLVHDNGQQGRDINVTADSVSTTGYGSDGIDVINVGQGGNTSVKVGTVATSGAYSWGVYGESIFGDLTINVGSVTTAGDHAPAVKTVNLYGNTEISADQINTSGAYSAGISAIGVNGDVSVHAGTIVTAGIGSDGIDASTSTYNSSTGASHLGGAVTVTAGSIYTTGDFSNGIHATGSSVDVTLNGTIQTNGYAARGIVARSYAGDTSVQNNGSIETHGFGANGIYAGATGNVTVSGAGTIQTTGERATALVAFSTGGSVSVTQGDISTSGEQAGGIYAGIRDIYGTGFTGDITIQAGDVATRGGGFLATGISAANYTVGGGITITAGDVSTRKDDAGGIRAVGYGATAVTANSVSTRGSGAHAIYAVGHSVDVTAASVSTLGDHSDGVYAVALASGSDAPSHLAVSAGTVSTAGDYSIGIRTFDNVDGSDVTVTTGGVSTSGKYSAGIYASSLSGSVTIDAKNVSTTGETSSGVIGRSIYGDVTIDAENVTVSGSHGNAIDAVSVAYQGRVSVTAKNISSSDSSSAIYASGASAELNLSGTIDKSGSYAAIGAFGRAGDVVIHNDATITTSQGTSPDGTIAGYGIIAGAKGNVTIDGSGSITTDSDVGTAIKAYSFGGGTVSVSQGTLTTKGDYSAGIAVVTANGYGYAATDGPGGITVSSDTITTTGFNSAGLLLSDNTKHGNVLAIVSGSVSTAQDFSTGVSLYAANGITAAKLGSVTTEGFFSQAVHLDGRDAELDLNGPVSTKGALSTAIVAYAGNGGIHISGAGPITTTGAYFSSGIRASSAGDIDISIGGPISTSGRGSAGIEVTERKRHAEIYPYDPPEDDGTTTLGDFPGDGPRQPEAAATGSTITIKAQSIATKGMNSDGIMVTTDTGDVDIKTGMVTTAGKNSVGIFAEGNHVVAETGNTASAQATAIVLGGYQSSKLTVNGATQGGADGVLLQGYDVGLTVTAGGSIKGGANAVVVDATPHVPTVVTTWGYFQDVGGYVPPQRVPPANPAPGAVTIDNGGTIVGGTGYAVVVTGGAAKLTNSGELVGAVKLSGGDDVVTNSGTFVATKDSDFGAGNDSFVNSGVVALAAGTKAANVSFLGLESFQNKGGIVDLRNGVAGDVLTLSGAYVGSDGARLGLDVGAGGVADRLVVAGAATGHTSILVNATAANATLLSKPVTLVQVGAGSAADAFSIAGPEAGFVAYGLTYDAKTNSFGLTTRASSSVRRLALVAQGAQAIWNQQADAWSSHMAELRDAGSGAGTGSRLWGQSYGKVDTLHAHADGTNLGSRQDYYGAQAGLDLAGRQGDDGNGFLFGVTGGYLSSHLNLRGGPERLRYDTLGLGGYASLRAGMLFVNLLGQYDHYRIDARDGVAHWSDTLDGNGYGAQAELGARLGSERFFAEPLASLAWQHSDIGTLHAFGQSVDFGHGSALQGKLGGRIGGTTDLGSGDKAVFYARAAWVHSFHGKGSALLESGGTSDAVSGVKLGDYGQGAVGVNILTTGRLSGFLEANVDAGHAYKGAGGKAGVRFKL